jgi:hypothetical protein
MIRHSSRIPATCCGRRLTPGTSWRRSPSVHFDPDAREDFLFWLSSDRKMAVRITRLIQEMQRDPFSGIGSQATEPFGQMVLICSK